MTVGLICAIPQELAHLQNKLDGATSISAAQAVFVQGTLDGHRVVLVGSGMGKVNAAVVATLLLDKFGCRAVVFSGVAGGLDPELSIGDVVIADTVVQYDSGIIEGERLSVYQPGHVRFFNPTEELGYAVSSELLARVRLRLNGIALPAFPRSAGGQDRPPRIAYGAVLTSDAYLHCATTRERLHREMGGLAVEMEGGAVAQTCAAFGVPWLVIRALSDLAGRDPDVDFTVFSEQVAAVSADIVRSILGDL